MEKDITELKNCPSIERVHEILVANVETPSFPYITALLEFTIPQLFDSIRDSKILIQTFQTLIGLGNLLNRISTRQEQSELYISILECVFDESLALNLVKGNPSPVEIREINKLVFKGKALAVVNEATTLSSIEITSECFKSTGGYVEYLSNSLLKLYSSNTRSDIIEEFLHSTLKFGDASSGLLCSIFSVHEKVSKERLPKSLFNNYIVRIAPNSNLNALFNLLSFTSDVFDEMVIESIIQTANKSLTQVVAMILTKSDDYDFLVNKLITKWSNSTVIKNEPISIQESRTFMIMQLISRRKGSALTKDLLTNKQFLNAINNRLSSFSNNIKALGVVLVDYVCELNGEKKIFSLAPEVDTYSSLMVPNVDITELPAHDCWEALKLKETTSPIKIESKQDVSQDLDDDDDDDSLPPQTDVADPIYVKQLIEYFSVDTSNQNAYEMRRKALLKGPTLLHQKYRYGTEVHFYSEELLALLIGLDNHFDDKDFNELKLNNMVAVIVTNPSITTFMFNLLLTGDYSLQQRVLILSATLMAARQLRGFSPTNFPSQTLPEPLHRKYLELEGGSKYIDFIENEVQKELLADASAEAQDQLLGSGKVVRVSSRLKRPAKSTETPTAGFYTIIGKLFYFPLLNVWYEAGTIDIGHYSPVYIGHYIKTLALLIHCALHSKSVSVSWELLVDDKLKSVAAGLLLRLQKLESSLERTIMDQSNSIIT
ncbi:Telomere length regulation family protein [Candida albicans]|uniref:Telomere length regulation family protein n=1 Tax=Candida albicans TaxID=5476 RepID=A0A8H6C0D7_CANAX|nr:Telomere length regulation family protein [Candida albicans]